MSYWNYYQGLIITIMPCEEADFKPCWQRFTVTQESCVRKEGRAKDEHCSGGTFQLSRGRHEHLAKQNHLLSYAIPGTYCDWDSAQLYDKRTDCIHILFGGKSCWKIY